jgi:hypothetical protein
MDSLGPRGESVWTIGHPSGIKRIAGTGAKLILIISQLNPIGSHFTYLPNRSSAVLDVGLAVRTSL